MLIRQEEFTPLGDSFHDLGLSKAFTKLSVAVDEFEVDTEEIEALCDFLITGLKVMKAKAKKAAAEYQKYKSQTHIEESNPNRYFS